MTKIKIFKRSKQDKKQLVFHFALLITSYTINIIPLNELLAIENINISYSFRLTSRTFVSI